jgi:hypothetical protein
LDGNKEREPGEHHGTYSRSPSGRFPDRFETDRHIRVKNCGAVIGSDKLRGFSA